MDYQKLYHILFNAVTDSLENMAEQDVIQLLIVHSVPLYI